MTEPDSELLSPRSNRFIRSNRLLQLAVLGMALELVFVAGFLLPLSLWRHHTVVTSSQPIATALGTGLAGALWLLLPTLAAFTLFGAAFWLARRTTSRAAIWLVLVMTLLFSLSLLATNPLASKDIFHNVFDARMFWLHGANPSVVPPHAFSHDPLYHSVSAWQTFASSYGPAWYLIAGLPLPFAGNSLWANVIGQKVLTAAFLLATTGLAMLIARRIRPSSVVAAGVLVGWNPLLQFETAGTAHNDIVMVFFALAAIYALQRRWWPAVFPLLALAVLTKYALILLGPLIVLWLLQDRDVPRRQILVSLLLGLAVAVALEAPFFSGVQTLLHLRRQASYVTSSPSALLYSILHTAFHVRAVRASSIAKIVAVPPFLFAYALVVRRLAARRGIEALIRASFWATYLLLTVLTWWFWPWYVVFLVPLAALLPESRIAVVAATFSAGAMIMYVPYFWLLHVNPIGLEAACVTVAFLPAALVALPPQVGSSLNRLGAFLRQRERQVAAFAASSAAGAGERTRTAELHRREPSRTPGLPAGGRPGGERHGSPN